MYQKFKQEEIKEIKRTVDRNTVVILKNGQEHVFKGQEGTKAFKSLSR